VDLLVGDGPLTILRTRAWSQIVYTDETVTGGYYSGNSFAPWVMRVAAFLTATGPDPFWPAAFDQEDLGGDDLITQDMTWGTPFYTPPNVPFGRPEGLLQYAAPAAGAADSKAQRRFSTFDPVTVRVSINMLDAGGGTVDELVNAFIWIKCLIRYG
jgi:hypothetical protein